MQEYRILGKTEIVREGDEYSSSAPNGCWVKSRNVGLIAGQSASFAYRRKVYGWSDIEPGSPLLPGDEVLTDKGWVNAEVPAHVFVAASSRLRGRRPYEQPYRPLAVGETILPGDEVMGLDGEWGPVLYTTGAATTQPGTSTTPCDVYRRPLKPMVEYRYLEFGEAISETDEFKRADDDWVPCVVGGGTVATRSLIYRRRVIRSPLVKGEIIAVNDIRSDGKIVQEGDKEVGRLVMNDGDYHRSVDAGTARLVRRYRELTEDDCVLPGDFEGRLREINESGKDIMSMVSGEFRFDIPNGNRLEVGDYLSNAAEVDVTNTQLVGTPVRGAYRFYRYLKRKEPTKPFDEWWTGGEWKEAERASTEIERLPRRRRCSWDGSRDIDPREVLSAIVRKGCDNELFKVLNAVRGRS